MLLHPVLKPDIVFVYCMPTSIPLFVTQLQQSLQVVCLFGEQDPTLFKALPYSAQSVCSSIFMMGRIIFSWYFTILFKR